MQVIGPFHDFQAASGQLRCPGVWKRRFLGLGEEHSIEGRANQERDIALDLRQGDSEGVREEQAEAVSGDKRFVTGE